jgi:thiol-disulfide isomerase/thioredoxin
MLIRCLIPLLIALFAGGGALVLRKVMRGHWSIKPPLAAVVGATILGTGGLYIFWAVFVPPARTWPVAPPPTIALPQGDYPAGALAVGDMAPQLEVDGWLNNPPQRTGPDGPRLRLIDIWAFWCPGCRDTAPGLVRLFDKYNARGVAFTSVTSMPRSSAEEFVEQFAVRWPCGYGMTSHALARFGALNRDLGMPGYEVKLTLYLLAADGRVLWCDGNARMRHQDPGPLIKQLDARIAQALGMGETP